MTLNLHITSRPFQYKRDSDRCIWFSSTVLNHKTFLSSFITHRTLGTGSLIALPPACLWRDEPPSLFYSFCMPPSEEIVSSVSVLPPLWDELYYRLCKQSVDMCCCLATVEGESSRISTAVFVCVCMHVWFSVRNVTLWTLGSAHMHLCDVCVCVCVCVWDVYVHVDMCVCVCVCVCVCRWSMWVKVWTFA